MCCFCSIHFIQTIQKKKLMPYTKSPLTNFTVTPASPHRKKIQRGPGGNRRNSSQSEPSSEADSAVDSPLSEPLNVDVSCILMFFASVSEKNGFPITWYSYSVHKMCSLVWIPPMKIQVLWDVTLSPGVWFLMSK
jgi:hypothetical protein